MKEIEYANEEMKHFSDLIDGFAMEQDQKNQLLRYIKLEIVGAYRAGMNEKMKMNQAEKVLKEELYKNEEVEHVKKRVEIMQKSFILHVTPTSDNIVKSNYLALNEELSQGWRVVLTEKFSGSDNQYHKRCILLILEKDAHLKG